MRSTGISSTGSASTGRRSRDRTALVTGGARGIGEGAATTMAALGARVVIVDKLPTGPGRRRRDRGCRWSGPVHPVRPERGRRGDGDDPAGDGRLRPDRHPRQQRPARHRGPDRDPRPGGLGRDVRHQRAGVVPDDQAPAPGHARAPERRDREHDRVRGWRRCPAPMPRPRWRSARWRSPSPARSGTSPASPSSPSCRASSTPR